MADWEILGGLFEAMQTHSPLLGRLWLQIIVVFRIVILGTVATDLFEDEQEQFECNTAQPGCKQVCYDQAFPISQYRFWVFHIVLISTPAVLFFMYAMHQNSKTKNHQQGEGGTDATASHSSLRKHGGVSMKTQQDLHIMRLYMLNVGFRFLAEVAFLVGQWALYGFIVASQYPCSRFPCPYTVDCFTSRPMEKTIFLCFYFAVGLLSALFSLAELVHVFTKWSKLSKDRRRGDEEMDTGEQERLIQGTGGDVGSGQDNPPGCKSRDGGGSVSLSGKMSSEDTNTSSRASGKGRMSGQDRNASSRESLDRNTSSKVSLERKTNSKANGKGRVSQDRKASSRESLDRNSSNRVSLDRNTNSRVSHDRNTSSRVSGRGRQSHDRNTSSRASGNGKVSHDRKASSRESLDRNTSGRDIGRVRLSHDRKASGRESLDRNTSRNLSSSKSLKSSRISSEKREAESDITSLNPLNT